MMNEKNITIWAIVLLVIVGGGVWAWSSFSDGQATPPDNQDQNQNEDTQNLTDLPLEIPEGYQFEILADVPEARDLAIGPRGDLWVSQTDENQISLLNINDETGGLENQQVIFDGLNRPHGITFDPDDPFTIFYAESDKVSSNTVYSEPFEQTIADLPDGGRHYTRSLQFGPDGETLFISIGSSCDTCVEQDERRAAIYRVNKDGTSFEQFAEGLRNAVFMTLHPETEELWVTEMGRDNLGDDTPPDEINIVREGNHYGWPYYYGDNVRDETFQSDTDPNIENLTPSHIDLQAHSAPLGLDFFRDNSWGEWQNDLLVAYHGSWNRTVPTGYKIVRFDLDDQGELQDRSDFISGWLQNPQPGGGDTLGRPVDVEITADGTIYISDDHNGTIYRLSKISQ